MDKSEFGKRLKKARIARRMTQSELAGDKVTRNMISRIENGVSVPSIGTLDVPISVLVPQDGDGETLTAAKARFSANEFDKVIEMLEPVAAHGFGKFEFYDEACALLAKSYLALAVETDDIRERLRLAKLCCEVADVGVYSNNAVLEKALDILSDIAIILQQ
mgnify:CR=1 FL=1